MSPISISITAKVGFEIHKKSVCFVQEAYALFVCSKEESGVSE